MKGGLERRVAELEGEQGGGRVFLTTWRPGGDLKVPAGCGEADVLYVLRFHEPDEQERGA